jgi:hypothetical protein
MAIKIAAKIMFNLPYNSKSGTAKNSIIFIVAIIITCKKAHSLGLILLIIHITLALLKSLLFW